jgi:hypothetical protein
MNLAVGWGAMACFACSGVPDQEGAFEEDSVDQVQQPIWESTCNDPAPDSTKSLTFNGSHSSAYDDTGCNKAFVKQVNNFQENGLWWVLVKDNGSVPTTQSACNALWGAVQLFEPDGDDWDPVTTSSDPKYQGYGVWVPASGGFTAHCNVPTFKFDDSLFTHGENYRIHASFRTSRTGSQRALHFLNQYEIE